MQCADPGEVCLDSLAESRSNLCCPHGCALNAIVHGLVYGNVGVELDLVT